MSPSETTLAAFEAKLRNLILHYKKLKEENEELYAMLEKSETANKRLQDELNKTKQKFNDYKTAKMIAVSDNDIQATKARLTLLIKHVNKCITLLSEQD